MGMYKTKAKFVVINTMRDSFEHFDEGVSPVAEVIQLHTESFCLTTRYCCLGPF